MDHNEFDFIDDLVQPFYHFLENMNISLEADENDPYHGQIHFAEHLFIPPADQVEKELLQAKSMTMWGWLLQKFIIR